MIYFYSTKNKNVKVSLQEAVMSGLAPDGGLFMPAAVETLSENFLKEMNSMSFSEISFEVCNCLFKNALPVNDLRGIIEKAINFDAPLKCITSGIYALELFHGPTLSFKDFGARFMSQLLGYFIKNKKQKLHILVATSGDTGSAVGDAFHKMPGIQVWILYPKGKVSIRQEQQLTTLGHNITALEVEGTFDDCQRLLKQAFSDEKLRQKITLTSANSINIARLIPQSFYYFYAYSRLQERVEPAIFSVPCGNFGNLTAGLLAKKMGLPVKKFVAATNVNDSVPKYLRSGVFEPHLSIHTLSNAMDVGNPSNFARMLDLYDHDYKKMRLDIFGESFTDSQTRSAIKEVLEKHGYLLDPHGAVAYLGLMAFLANSNEKANGIFLETAHPAKFAEDVENIIHQNVLCPPSLQEALSKQKKAIALTASYESFCDLLTSS